MNGGGQTGKPLRSLEQAVFLNLLRSADVMQRPFEELFKQAGLSATQYNVLRILRAAGQNGLACKQIGDRLITRDPDLTRLLDRLEKRGLIERSRQEKDRRVVIARITRTGLAILAPLDEPVQSLHKQQ